MTSNGEHDELVTWRTTEHASCARHHKYALDCKQFDAALERSGGLCELCGLEGRDSAWGVLHIDHEHDVGTWAVRGLLCDACNVRFQRGRRLPQTPPLQRYLANAWYRTELDRLGLSDEPPAEPGLGSSVRAGRHSWTRIDAEIAECWASARRGSRVEVASWGRIWYDQGPFHFQVTRERDAVEKWDMRFFRFGIDHVEWIKKQRAGDPGIDFYSGWPLHRLNA